MTKRSLRNHCASADFFPTVLRASAYHLNEGGSCKVPLNKDERYEGQHFFGCVVAVLANGRGGNVAGENERRSPGVCAPSQTLGGTDSASPHSNDGRSTSWRGFEAGNLLQTVREKKTIPAGWPFLDVLMADCAKLMLRPSAARQHTAQSRRCRWGIGSS